MSRHFTKERSVLSFMVMTLVALAAASSSILAQSSAHRWAGLVFDAFTIDGATAASVEDGGRVRLRDAAGNWTFASVDAVVKDTLRRVHMLSMGPTGLGWAVGQNGWLVKTTNGGSSWTQVPPRFDDGIPGDDVWEDLYDVHFVDASTGWVLGLHHLWLTTNGGSTWNLAMLRDIGGQPLDPSLIELYALDVVPGPGPSQPYLGLAVAEPGYVLRTTDGVVWQVTWKIESLCGGGVLVGCEADLCGPGNPFEPWDVEISRHPTQKLALLAGGIGNQCGLIFRSADDGSSWTKEFHECTCTGPGCKSCVNDPLYNDNPAISNDTWRHQYFRTIYGLAILDADNTAVAACYNGQHLVRNPVTGVWEDRSVFSDTVPTTANSVNFPLLGAAANGGNGTTGQAILTGEGGFIRRSTDGGQTWNGDGVIGEPHRIADVHFISASVGWQVGQFFRIARSGDGGVSWAADAPDPQPNTMSLKAITVAPDNTRGITVGDPFTPSAIDSPRAKILYNLNVQTLIQWQTPTRVNGNPIFMVDKGLREVDYAGGNDFWAAGEGGLILATGDNGVTWNLFTPPGDPTIHEYFMEAVAFRDQTTGLFAGVRPDPPTTGPVRGAVYEYIRSGPSVTWTKKTLVLSSGDAIIKLGDVDIVGNDAYVVGEKLVSGVPRGVVLRATFSGGAFGTFDEVVNPAGFPRCTAGEGLDEVPILNRVEIVPLNGDVWVAGECGRLWKYLGGTSWLELKSQTDAHGVGMSFVPTGPSSYAGYIAGFRASQTQQSIVRVQQP